MQKKINTDSINQKIDKKETIKKHKIKKSKSCLDDDFCRTHGIKKVFGKCCACSSIKRESSV
ncbi:MAG: hypothetical protein WC466_06300 [Candidatus Izemoplasmatales bacterium]